MIEIAELSEPLDENREWRVTWPEPDGSKGTYKCGSIELAVEHALMVRLLLRMNEGRLYRVIVSDDLDEEFEEIEEDEDGDDDW